MKLNPSEGAWRVDLPVPANEPDALKPETPKVETAQPDVAAAKPADAHHADANQALPAQVRSQLSLKGPAAPPVAGAPAPAAIDPRLSGAKDDQAAFEAASQILGQAPAAAAAAAEPPKPYAEVFGAAPWVEDPANAEMVKLFGAAIAKAPELAATPLAEHVKAGQVGQDDVRAMQDFLVKQGHSVGATGADGLFGPRTHEAIAAFIKGEAPPATGGEGPAMTKGATGEAVRKLQARLSELGFDPQGADGQFGPNTLSAVKAFQTARGLEADGVVGPKTWDQLGIKVPASELDAAPAPAAGDSNDVTQTPDGPMVRRDGTFIRAELAPHWDEMVAAAAQAGVNLRINDGYRSKAEQQVLWDEALAKYGSASAASKWVAPPGTSNHQAGKALDIHLDDGVYNWLSNNGSKFGFNQPMSWENWHWEHPI